MNNTALKIIAGLLFIGAVVVAYMGIQLSRQPAKPAPPPVVQASPSAVPTEMVLVAARSMKAGHTVVSADLTTKGIPNPPALAFRDAQEVLGKAPLADIPTGSTLLPAQFAADSMASLLKPGERAVAISVDEVGGIGGYVKPGDHVDVLLFIAGGRETSDTSSAQVAVQNARLLSLGEANQMDEEEAKRAQGDTKKLEAKSATSYAQEVKERRQGLKSAVIAVLDADVTRLMLASGSGQLRLALRPPGAPAPLLASQPKDSGAVKVPPTHNPITLAEIAPGSKKAPGRGADIIIQEGSKERRLDENKTNPQP